jgi:hypothetical protein
MRSWETRWSGSAKTVVSCHSRFSTVKTPLFANAISSEQRPKFCSLSLAMRDTFSRDIIMKSTKINEIY